jgi:DegV family protein with EDD domain
MERTMSIAIISDTDTSLPQNILQEYGIRQVPITIHFGEEVLDACSDITDQGLVDRVERDGVIPTTAAPSPGAFSEVYQQAFDAGAEEILCMTVSGGVSATYQSALSAKDLLPDQKITVFDTESISLGQGFMVLEAARLAREGKSTGEILEAVKDLRERTHLYAALDTLKYMAMSGRVGHLTAEMANVLSIKPILTIMDGKLDLLEKVRTRKKAWSRVLELSLESLGEGEIQEMYIFQTAAEDLAADFEALLRGAMPCPETITITELTPGLSVHTGAGLVGVAFTTKA